MKNSLVPIEKLDVAVVFSQKGMDNLLKEVKAKVIVHVPDIDSDSGRKDIAALAYKIARSKTLIDNMGKDLIADWQKKIKPINGLRKTARDFLDNLKEEARQPLTDYENLEAEKRKEEQRKEKEKIENRIELFSKYNFFMPFMEVAVLTDEAFGMLLTEKREVYEVEEAEAIEAKKQQEAEADRLKKLLKEQQAEADRLTKIQADIDAKERALKDEEKRLSRIGFERKAEEKAKIQAEKDAAIKAEKDAIEAKEKAERETQRKIEKKKAEEAERMRLLELAPDKDKLILFADRIQNLTAEKINLKSKEAQSLFGYTVSNILILETDFRKEIERL